MVPRITNFLARMSLVERFTLVSFFFMVAGLAGISWWVGEQIKAGVIKESAAMTALYMDSFIAPSLQELSYDTELSADHIANLTNLLSQTDFGSQIVAFKVWDSKSRILYSINPALIGHTFMSDDDVIRAFQGEVVASISDLQDDENVEERKNYKRLIQIYSPVRLNGTSQIIAVAEFYTKVDALDAEIATAQWRSWWVVAFTMLAIYGLLVGFVNWASQTIGQQKTALTQQVQQLTELMLQNEGLNKRVRRAAANATALNERFLRRISAELHDGPTQELGLAILRLDHVASENEAGRADPDSRFFKENLPVIQEALSSAMSEMRIIAAGLGVPQLEKLSLPEVIVRAVRSYEKRAGTSVALDLQDLPEQAGLPVKITAYRIIKEALNNAHRHAPGPGQQVLASCQAGELTIVISDQGPGFDITKTIDWDEHLGLAGMRERVESLGGFFQVESSLTTGTKVIARLTLQEPGVR